MNNYEKIKRACQIASGNILLPPQLGDVILICQYWMSISAEDKGFVTFSRHTDSGENVVYWDLTKPLADQSEECLKFIADLL